MQRHLRMGDFQPKKVNPLLIVLIQIVLDEQSSFNVCLPNTTGVFIFKTPSKYENPNTFSQSLL